MIILFAAGHVGGTKIWMGYNEDVSMLDLARRKAQYSIGRYGQDARVFDVTTGGSYNLVEAACRGCDIASFEHSNADDSVDEPNEPNRVVVYRTVLNPGDGPCRLIGQACADILQTTLSPIQHRANSNGSDWYGVIKRAMTAGCQDAYLIEHGFHTHGPTREKLSNPAVRQQLAEAEVDAMAVYYGWKPNTEEGDDMIKYLEKSENVKLWQRALMDAGFDLAPYGADGSFGPLTRTKTNEFKNSVGLPIDDPATVTLVEWYAMQAYQKGQFSDDGITQADLDKEIAKTKEALQAVSVLQEEIQGLKVQVNNRQDDLSALANIEKVKKEILARYGLAV